MNDIFNLDEAAAMLKLKPNYLYQLVYYKKIKAYKPNGGRLYFKKSDLEKYAFSNPTMTDIHEEAEKIINRPRKQRRRKNG